MIILKYVLGLDRQNEGTGKAAQFDYETCSVTFQSQGVQGHHKRFKSSSFIRRATSSELGFYARYLDWCELPIF